MTKQIYSVQTVQDSGETYVERGQFGDYASAEACATAWARRGYLVDIVRDRGELARTLEGVS